MQKTLGLSVLLTLLAAASFAQTLEFEVRQLHFEKREPSLTAADRAEIFRQAGEFRRALQAEGRLNLAAPQTVLFDWPLRPAAHLTDPGYHGISGFVDHDPAYPDQLTDYHCGTRTYDLDSGYNHLGTDFFLWPHYWNKMDNDDVEIVAAAAGTIVSRQDGHYDRNCGFGAGDWNGVVILHDDGSIAAYIHMKLGSVTPKAVGQTVETGEYLGIVGSSGSSTGPHLHFEVWDAGDNPIDPWSGPCNTMNPTSWWLDQRPYYDSAINQIATHSAPIGWGAECPAPDTLHTADTFALGDTVYFYAFGRDALMDDVFTIGVFQPDSALFFADSYTFDLAPHWPAIAFVWGDVIPPSGPTGTWRYEFYYKGETYRHFFQVSPPTAVAFAHTSAEVRDGAVEIYWEVDADEPIAGFEVFRARAGVPGGTALTAGARLDSQTRRFVDRGVRTGMTYDYTVSAVRPDGSSVRSRTVTASVPAGETALLPNFPNPFNPSTTIQFTLAEPSMVRLAVFDMRGALVAVLEEGPCEAGRHTARWDGRTDGGTPAASGVYFFRLDAGKRTRTIKSVLLK